MLEIPKKNCTTKYAKANANNNNNPFALCFYCLSGVDFARFFRKGHSHKAQGLLLLFALALASFLPMNIQG